MPFKAAMVDQMLDHLYARTVVSGLRLYAPKNMHVSLVLASRRCIRRDHHAKRRRLHPPAWPRVKQEKEEEISQTECAMVRFSSCSL
jgi:hypothetical protein